MPGQKRILWALLMSSVVLWGCGNSGSGGDQTGAGMPAGTVTDPETNINYSLGVDPNTGVARTGSYSCIGCHQGYAWSAAAVGGYLQGKHALHSGAVNLASSADCLSCHAPLGDSGLIQSRLKAFLASNPTIAAANPEAIPLAGLAAIGCEACHGAGGQHFGAPASIPVPTPDYKVCGACHNAGMPHQVENPFGDNIVENFKLSGHLKSIEAAGLTPASLPALCARCHADQGFRKYAAATSGLDANGLSAALGAEPALSDGAPVQCRTCHDPHSGKLRFAETGVTIDHDANPATAPVSRVVFSASFNLCTSCHMNFLTYTWDLATQQFTYTQDSAKVLQHGGGLGGVGHFDNPATPAVEGFNINAADDMACLYCHDPHGATSFRQAAAIGFAEIWGQTRGFDGDYKGPAFTGQKCTPCHSPVGLAQLALGLPYAETATQARVIGCVGCHDLQAKNADGTAFALGSRRSLPAFAFNHWRAVQAEQRKTDPTAPLRTVAGLGDNILCMTCHGGRESTFSVNAALAASPGPYDFLNVHNRAAGATLFGSQAKGAYEFSGKVYASKFEHVVSHDMCIECHNSHSGLLNIKSAGGPAGCNTCHNNITIDPALDYAGALAQVRDIRMTASFADYDGDGNTTEGLYYEVEGLKARLLTALQNYAANTIGVAIQYNADVSPYFFKTGPLTLANRYTAMDATLLKAAYNYQFSQKDPGVYGHNPSYIVEILYDSIEAVGGDVNLLTRDDSGHFNPAAEPFRHWDGEAQVALGCSKCHSSEGAAYFLANGSQIPAFSRQYTMGKASGLACESCHVAPYQGTRARPGRRQPTEVAFPSGVVLTAASTGTTPDFFANDSKLCMTCHQGRGAKSTVDANIAAGKYDFVNIHYFAAAATMFGSQVHGGYEYDGKSYAGQMTYPSHVALGAPYSRYTTCAGCHMLDAAGETFKNHDFKPALANCLLCHNTATTTSFRTMGLGVGTNFTNIKTLKDQLLGVITASGVTVLPGYPYFSGITTAAQLKACYNWQVADKEPAGYIHNPDYMLQLLWDSIDDLSNHGVTPLVARP